MRALKITAAVIASGFSLIFLGLLYVKLSSHPYDFGGWPFQCVPSVVYDPSPLKCPPLPILPETSRALKQLKSIAGMKDKGDDLKANYLCMANELKRRAEIARVAIKSKLANIKYPKFDPQDMVNLPCIPFSKGSVDLPKKLDHLYIFLRLLCDDLNIATQGGGQSFHKLTKLLVPVDRFTYGELKNVENGVFVDLIDPEYFLPRLMQMQLSSLTSQIGIYNEVLGAFIALGS